jgi:tetratricopeptide (TPR) repeat protein
MKIVSIKSYLWALAGAAMVLAGSLARAAGPGDLDLVRASESAYKNNNFAEAVRDYERLAERAPSDPAVLYNLGTAYARSGQPGHAIWRYLKVIDLAPRDRDTRENLDLLAPQWRQQWAITPLPPINRLYLQLTANEWTEVGGAAAVLALLLGALYFRTPRSRVAARRLVRGLCAAATIAAAIAWPLAIVHYYQENMTWRAVVVEQNTVAHTGPGENQIQTDALPMGTVLRVLDDSTPGWLKYSYAGGRKGFVQRDRIRFL